MAISSSSLLLLVLVFGSVQRSAPASSTYKAAVVEFKPAGYKTDSAKTLNENAEKLVTFIAQAANGGADIVVLPEFGLTSQDFPERPELGNWATLVPDPWRNFSPRVESKVLVSDALKKISEAAYESQIYVIVNLIEKDECSGVDCSLFYISNVVFDRSGTIIARYRKTHQFDNLARFNRTKSPEPSIFETDFGVTFSNVINTDMMFEEPLLNLIKNSGITDIVDTAAWRSEMPFLTTIQVQAGWACAEDVNLLAAGYSQVDKGYSGSGIYSGCRVIDSVMSFDDNERVLINEVPIKPKKAVLVPVIADNKRQKVPYTSDYVGHHVHDEFRRKRDLQMLKLNYEKLDGFETKLIVKDGLTLQKLSHNKIDCEYHEYQVNVTLTHL